MAEDPAKSPQGGVKADGAAADAAEKVLADLADLGMVSASETVDLDLLFDSLGAQPGQQAGAAQPQDSALAAALDSLSNEADLAALHSQVIPDES